MIPRLHFVLSETQQYINSQNIDKCATLKCVSNRPGARNCTNPSLEQLKLGVHIGKLNSIFIYDIIWTSCCFKPEKKTSSQCKQQIYNLLVFVKVYVRFFSYGQWAIQLKYLILDSSSLSQIILYYTVCHIQQVTL